MRKSLCVSLKTQAPSRHCLSCSFLLHTHLDANRRLLPPLTNADIKPHINFSFISNIYSYLDGGFSLTIFLSRLTYSQLTWRDNAGEILMCSVGCCCLERCPDRELCPWTEGRAKQPFRGSGRGPCSWMKRRRQLQAGPRLIHRCFAQCK